MAEFKTHLTGGMVAGISIALGGSLFLKLNAVQTCAVFLMGVTGGILPDLDSDSGKPLAILCSQLSVLIPALLVDRIVRDVNNSPEFLISYFVLSYFFINNIICEIIKKITKHRGIMHSIPFAFLCGGGAYHLFVPSGRHMAITAGVALFSGCIVHLALDELNSLTIKFGVIPVIKNSCGTALKFRSGSGLATAFIYIITIFLFIKM